MAVPLDPDAPDMTVLTAMEYANAEQALIGAVLRDPSRLDFVRQRLTEDDFRVDRTRRAWAIVVHLADKGQPIDLVTVFQEAQRRGWTADVGNAGRLVEMYDAVGHSANAELYAELVWENSTCGRLLDETAVVRRDILLDGTRDGMIRRPARDLGEDAIARISAVIDRGGRPDRLVPVSRAVGRVLSAADSPTAAQGLMTGMPVLDGYLGGLLPGELVCLGARPGVGKSALALQVADAVAEAGRKVLFVSLEMSADEIAKRLLVGRSGVPNRRLKANRLTGDDGARLHAAADAVRPLPLLLCDDPNTSADDVAADARRLARGGDLALVVVDYLQLLRPRNDRQRRHEQVADMSRRLKLAAKAAGVPVLMLSQLSRAPEDENRPPRLSDLRESGSIEQDCDVVLFLHRTTDVRADREPVDLLVAKQRNGMTGEIRLEYDGPQFRFSEWAPE